MCIKNTSKNVADGSGVVGDHDCYEISSSRKTKKQRIPKRGPGVAELEKILRQQEKNDGHVENGKIIGGISSSFLPSLAITYPLRSSFASSSNCLRRNVAFIPDSDHNHLASNTPSMSMTPHDLPSTLHVNGSGDLKGHAKVVCIDGSGVFLPEQTLLPLTRGPCETRKGEEVPKMATDFSFPMLVSNGSHHTKMFPPPMVQKKPGHPSMIDLHASKQMNLFPQSTISSSATPSSSSAGVYHHVEPPSNRKSCHNYTQMIGAKRSMPNFPIDSRQPDPPHMPSQPSPFHPQISRLDPSPSSINNAVLNPGTASCRDPMPSNPLELKARSCVNDHGNPSGNSSAFITLGSPTAPSPSTQNCQPDFSNFIKQFPFQEMKESTKGLLQLSSSNPDESVQKKSSFFSFLLQPEEKRDGAEGTVGLKNTDKCTQKTEEFIDLSLKL